MNVADLIHRLSKLPPHYEVFFEMPGGRSAPYHAVHVRSERVGHYVNYDGHNVLPHREGDDGEIDSVVLLQFESPPSSLQSDTPSFHGRR
jgi:hypothetical protein